jgi:hypothetical protein
MILMAQSVPAATSVPCVATLPSGWSLGGLRVRKGESAFWLNSDRGGTHAVEATLRPAAACAVGGATEVPSDEVGMRRFEQPLALPPRLRTTRTYLFEGGCVTYDFDIEGQAVAALVFDADSALAFQPRTVLVEKVKEDSGLRLCGAGVSCPGGTRGGKGG